MHRLPLFMRGARRRASPIQSRPGITIYSMQFFREAKGQAAVAAGAVVLSSRTQAGAMRQARQLWETQGAAQAATGYRLVHQPTAAVAYEYRSPGTT